MVRYGLKLISILILFNLFLVISLPVINAQEETEEPAEIVATVKTPDNKIPSIRISNWTAINISVFDAFGINWTQLTKIFPIQSRYWWPIRHPNWRPFLGFSSLRFEPEIVEGDPRGWYAKITPSAIPEADQGRTYDLILEVQTDDIAVDYAVVVGIKTTRLNVYGDVAGVSYIYVPVKASSLNNIKMETDETKKDGGLHSIVHFDINLRNFGYYRDMFKLNFTEENGLEALAEIQVIVLDPGESQNVGIEVFTPEKLWDPGTPNKISIYASSSSDPNPIPIGTLVIVTRGIYISPLVFIILAPIIIILFIIFIFFYHQRERKLQKILVKPKKPWTIPEEKKHLDELKEKDKQKYEEELTMMASEYKSAMLWYKNYINTIRGNEANKIKIVEIFKSFFKRNYKVDKSKKSEPIVKEKKKSSNKLTKLLPISKTKTNKNKKNDYKITKIIQSSEIIKPKKPFKKKKVKKPNKLDIIKPKKEVKRVDEQSKKEKLIAQIKKDQEKQKSRI